MYEGNESVAALYDDALSYERQVVEFVFYFLRIDILSVGAEEHVLFASLYVEVAVW